MVIRFESTKRTSTMAACVCVLARGYVVDLTVIFIKRNEITNRMIFENSEMRDFVSREKNSPKNERNAQKEKWNRKVFDAATISSYFLFIFTFSFWMKVTLNDGDDIEDYQFISSQTLSACDWYKRELVRCAKTSHFMILLRLHCFERFATTHKFNDTLQMSESWSIPNDRRSDCRPHMRLQSSKHTWDDRSTFAKRLIRSFTVNYLSARIWRPWIKSKSIDDEENEMPTSVDLKSNLVVVISSCEKSESFDRNDIFTANAIHLISMKTRKTANYLQLYNNYIDLISNDLISMRRSCACVDLRGENRHRFYDILTWLVDLRRHGHSCLAKHENHFQLNDRWFSIASR